ncbi:MAG: hypothetical protein IT204_16060 [Fimbriimonadaceae bacterium]|nr:hypothetical protein [Fimbriimonadaceae bacterium]
MAQGISKTIPQSAGRAALEALYDGSLAAFEFHIAGNLSKVAVGDWVYTIFGDQLHGRCRITELIGGAVNPCSGRPRTLVMVACPGERLAEPLPLKGHQGTRYYDGSNWPGA